MAEADRHESLIHTLASDLRPVRRLRSPWLRALAWLALVGVAGAVLAGFGGLGTVGRRLSGSIDECAVMAGAAATTILAAFAAFLLSVPDRKPGWALLPLPALILWLFASTWGCLHPGSGEAAGSETHAPQTCFTFIVGVSAPLSVLLFLMLRRAYPVRPGLTAALAGLAAAAAAATLLEFFHPFDVTALDLLVHIGAVLVVIGANRVFSGAALRWAGR